MAGVRKKNNQKMLLTNSLLETSDAGRLLDFIKEQNPRKKPKLFGTSNDNNVKLIRPLEIPLKRLSSAEINSPNQIERSAVPESLEMVTKSASSEQNEKESDKSVFKVPFAQHNPNAMATKSPLSKVNRFKTSLLSVISSTPKERLHPPNFNSSMSPIMSQTLKQPEPAKIAHVLPGVSGITRLTNDIKQTQRTYKRVNTHLNHMGESSKISRDKTKDPLSTDLNISNAISAKIDLALKETRKSLITTSQLKIIEQASITDDESGDAVKCTPPKESEIRKKIISEWSNNGDDNSDEDIHVVAYSPVPPNRISNDAACRTPQPQKLSKSQNNSRKTQLLSTPTRHREHSQSSTNPHHCNISTKKHKISCLQDNSHNTEIDLSRVNVLPASTKQKNHSTRMNINDFIMPQNKTMESEEISENLPRNKSIAELSKRQTNDSRKGISQSNDNGYSESDDQSDSDNDVSSNNQQDLNVQKEKSIRNKSTTNGSIQNRCSVENEIQPFPSVSPINIEPNQIPQRASMERSKHMLNRTTKSVNQMVIDEDDSLDEHLIIPETQDNATVLYNDTIQNFTNIVKQNELPQEETPRKLSNTRRPTIIEDGNTSDTSVATFFDCLEDDAANNSVNSRESNNIPAAMDPTCNDDDCLSINENIVNSILSFNRKTKSSDTAESFKVPPKVMPKKRYKKKKSNPAVEEYFQAVENSNRQSNSQSRTGGKVKLFSKELHESLLNDEEYQLSQINMTKSRSANNNENSIRNNISSNNENIIDNCNIEIVPIKKSTRKSKNKTLDQESNNKEDFKKPKTKKSRTKPLNDKSEKKEKHHKNHNHKNDIKFVQEYYNPLHRDDEIPEGVRRSSRTRRLPGIYWSSSARNLQDSNVSSSDFSRLVESRQNKKKAVKKAPVSNLPVIEEFEPLVMNNNQEVGEDSGSSNISVSISKNEKNAENLKTHALDRGESSKLVKAPPGKKAKSDKANSKNKKREEIMNKNHDSNLQNEYSNVNTTNRSPSYDSGVQSNLCERDEAPNLIHKLLNYSTNNISTEHISFIVGTETCKLRTLDSLNFIDMEGCSYAQFLSTDEENSGIIKILGGQTKPAARSKSFKLDFFIIHGDVNVKLSDDVDINLKVGSFLTIPKGIKYEICNNFKDVSIIFFKKTYQD